MPTQPEERQRLAALMDDRRLQLGMRWQQVADVGGISLRALNNARSGDREIRPLTRRGIEKGLQWAPGFIERYLSGAPADPGGARWDEKPQDEAWRPHPDDYPADLPDDVRLRHIGRTPGMPEADRRELITWIIDRRAEVRGGEGPRRHADAG